jgi:D-glycero-alpha-D-manno-heptose-7-phosphate kinase
MIITQTPLRVSFFGGGTDYPEYFTKHGGAVLGTAIDKALFFSMSHFYSKLFDYSLRIAYRQVECVKSLDDIQHIPFRECLRWAGITQDVEITNAAELPAFSGLGSSSSFVVGLLNTIYAFQLKMKPNL